MWDVLASIATVLGIPAAVWQLWLARHQAQTAFEQTYIDRYWSINDDRLRQEPAGRYDTVYADRYLRLSEDQFELMRLGRVTWSTWDVWHDGIRGELRAPLIAGKLNSSDPGVFTWLKECQWQSRDHPHHGHECDGVLGQMVDQRYAPVRLHHALGRRLVQRRVARELRASGKRTLNPPN